MTTASDRFAAIRDDKVPGTLNDLPGLVSALVK
jgi:hypothetical protein